MKYESIRNLLFMLPTETAHHLSLQSIGALGQWNLSSLVARDVADDPVEVMGLTFPNPVGLAAGLDKDGHCIDGMARLGFGFIEIGTVTPRPQPGNPKPRLFRLPEHEALINRMGFNNDGCEQMVKRVRRARYKGILGINIGKNFDTPVQDALGDYIACMHKVYRVASYIVVNVSSPNTPGLRDLQHADELRGLLAGLKEEHAKLAVKHERSVPLVIKIAPDMSEQEIGSVCAALLEFEIDGVIVSNTTISREPVKGHRHADREGGLSGAPLLPLANQALAGVAAEVKGKMAIVGVGGISRGEDAAEKIRLGADLVQIYTGFIYHGPDLIRDSADAIRAQKRALS